MNLQLQRKNWKSLNKRTNRRLWINNLWRKNLVNPRMKSPHLNSKWPKRTRSISICFRKKLIWRTHCCRHLFRAPNHNRKRTLDNKWRSRLRHLLEHHLFLMKTRIRVRMSKGQIAIKWIRVKFNLSSRWKCSKRHIKFWWTRRITRYHSSRNNCRKSKTRSHSMIIRPKMQMKSSSPNRCFMRSKLMTSECISMSKNRSLWTKMRKLSWKSRRLWKH